MNSDYKLPSIILLFHDFPWPTTKFHDFPSLENEILNFTTFQFSNRFVQPACIYLFMKWKISRKYHF